MHLKEQPSVSKERKRLSLRRLGLSLSLHSWGKWGGGREGAILFPLWNSVSPPGTQNRYRRDGLICPQHTSPTSSHLTSSLSPCWSASCSRSTHAHTDRRAFVPAVCSPWITLSPHITVSLSSRLRLKCYLVNEPFLTTLTLSPTLSIFFPINLFSFHST